MIKSRITRRGFMKSTAAGAALLLVDKAHAQEPAPAPIPALDFPLVDFHVHLDKSTIDDVVKLGAERGVKFGIVEHAGVKENVYPTVLSNDAELRAYIAMLKDKPVYKGVQAEYSDWTPCFSKEALAELDYVLTDTMTFPGPDGRRMKMWEEGAEFGDPKTFMDRYVDWYLQIMAQEPLHLLANLTWLPKPFSADFDAHWTEARMSRIIETAIKRNIALEISASFQLPKMPFLRLAKAAGAKFALGSNGRYPNMGKLDYARQMAAELGLTAKDMFVPRSA